MFGLHWRGPQVAISSILECPLACGSGLCPSCNSQCCWQVFPNKAVQGHHSLCLSAELSTAE